MKYLNRKLCSLLICLAILGCGEKKSELELNIEEKIKSMIGDPDSFELVSIDSAFSSTLLDNVKAELRLNRIHESGDSTSWRTELLKDQLYDRDGAVSALSETMFKLRKKRGRYIDSLIINDASLNQLASTTYKVTFRNKNSFGAMVLVDRIVVKDHKGQLEVYERTKDIKPILPDLQVFK